MMKLQRFGHHPEPSGDFCIEVEALEGLIYNFNVGIENNKLLITERIKKALQFRTGGCLLACQAKTILRKLEQKFK